MARFRYKMQNILDIKYKLEDQAKTAFSTAAAKLMEEEEKMQQLRNRKASYEEEARVLAMNRLNIPKIKQCKAAIEAIKEAIRNQAVAVHIAQRNLESARVHLNEVMTDRKTHEKLKEKAFEVFKQELEEEETKSIDELVSYKFKNKTKE